MHSYNRDTLQREWALVRGFAVHNLNLNSCDDPTEFKCVIWVIICVVFQLFHIGRQKLRIL